jgi:spore germination cell wall hydrolase CwlJ-like protein
MYAESRGEPLEGLIAVGQATVNRAEKTSKTICGLAGVKRKAVPKALSNHFNALAKSIINGQSSVVGNANSWNTGKRPAYPGKVERVIGKHVFYAMNNL